MHDLGLAADDDLAEVFSIYEQSFPASERVPPAVLEGALGTIRTCLVLRVDRRIGAFAVLLRLSPTLSLLEYMAVHPTHRGGGLGTAMLAHVRDTVADDVVFEVEDPKEPGLPQSDVDERLRRVAFYSVRGCYPVSCELAYRPPSFDHTPAARLLLYTMTPSARWSLGETAEALVAISRTAYSGR